MIFTAWSLVKILIPHFLQKQTPHGNTSSTHEADEQSVNSIRRRLVTHKPRNTSSAHSVCRLGTVSPAPGSSMELLTQRNLLYNCSSVLITSTPAHTHTLPSPSVPSPAPASLMNIIMPPPLPLIIHELVSAKSCAPTRRRKKGGVSEWARVTTPACKCVHVCESVK